MADPYAGPPVDHAFGDYQPRFDVKTARQIMDIPDPPAEYALLGPYVSRGARTIIVGDTGHGKTSLALQMLAAIVTGQTMLTHTGAGVGPVLVLDLEQGIRSIKRGLTESGLADRDDVLYVSAPDGLALDKDLTHLAALNEALEEHQPVALLLDPFYKAHRADDPNAERPIIDLMRQLDGLRAVHGFALILPAHPRKDIAGRDGVRKLTIHDVSGSGAVTRGAEIVIGVERVSHGYARLRNLKDRDGDLRIGDALSLVYTKERGFRVDPNTDTSEETIVAKILAEPQPWMTVKEWAKTLELRQTVVRSALAGLAATGRVAHMIGPPGRKSSAVCYGSDPEAWDHMGSHAPSLFSSATDPDPCKYEVLQGEGRDQYEEPDQVIPDGGITSPAGDADEEDWSGWDGEPF